MHEVSEGSHKLRVSVLGTYILEQPIEVREGLDVEVELPTAEISGQVLDAEAGGALEKVSVKLLPLAPAGSTSGAEQSRLSRETRSDSLGRFRLPAVESGRYTLRVQHPGYAWLISELEVGTNPIRGIELALSPSAGLAPRVTSTYGSTPSGLDVFLVDPDGREVPLSDVKIDAEGKVDLPAIPAAGWKLWVSAHDSAWTVLDVKDTSEEMPVALTAQAQVLFRLRGLEQEAELDLSLRDATGRQLPRPRFGSLDWGGHGYARKLWPGEWTLEISHPDGRSWRAQFTAGAGEVIELELR